MKKIVKTFMIVLLSLQYNLISSNSNDSLYLNSILKTSLGVAGGYLFHRVSNSKRIEFVRFCDENNINFFQLNNFNDGLREGAEWNRRIENGEMDRRIFEKFKIFWGEMVLYESLKYFFFGAASYNAGDLLIKVVQPKKNISDICQLI